MKLTLEGLKDKQAFKDANINLPDYDVEKVIKNTKENPRWVHFGIGNIFRVFIGSIADKLLTEKEMETGLTCVEAFDYELVDKIYKPYDNLGLSVILNGDGSREYNVLAANCEAIKAKADESTDWQRLKEIFAAPSLQLVTFTITEKGYSLKDANGNYFPYILNDIENGPANPGSAMAILVAVLHERYKADKLPLGLLSLDNVSQNGLKLETSVMELAEKWLEKGFVTKEFIDYLSDRSKITFPWSMIDKITPRPSLAIAADLENLGLENMQPVITQAKTFIAPFINAEKPQYLVIEDNFPNGRPDLTKAGVYLTDRETVNKAEKMKVTVCLNPIHSALGPMGCVLGYELFSDEMKDEEMLKLAKIIGYKEGMEVVADPLILSPKAFLDECINERFPNPYLGDTTQRLAVDMSQIVGIRFGETIKAFVNKYGDAKKLIGLPLAIAGWLRYLLAVQDDGKPFELAPDPMNEQLTAMLSTIEFGNPDSLTDQLKPILSNVNIFRINLYDAGIGELIEDLFRKEIAGPGALRSTLKKYLCD